MQLTAFIGRERDQARLIELVTTAPLVTVTGPGGIGKTRLVRETAVELARRVTEEVAFVELARLPAGSDVRAVEGESGFSSAEAAAVAMCERSGLLVLDNCEHVLDAAAEFAARFMVAGDGARVLATSRETLGIDGERVYVLDPLGLPEGPVDLEDSEAVQLFLDRAAAAGAQWERSPELLGTVAELCRRLDGLPLAIELAAARSRALTPTDMLANIDSRLELLRRPALRGLTSRHNSMRAAIDTSVALLDADERRAFFRLGVFAGPFDADLAVAVIGDPDDEPVHQLDLLARLVERSLVVSEQTGPLTTYRLLELLREHARAALERDGELDLMQERFVDGMAAVADEIVSEGVQVWTPDLIARSSTAFNNLCAAIEWTLAHDDGPHRAFRLFLPMFVAVHQSRSREVVDLGARIFERWRDDLAPWRAEALAVYATAAVVAGDPERAMRVASASLDDPSATGVARLVARRALGFATRATRRYAEAAEHFGRGLAEAKELGATSYVRELQGFVASVLDLQGRGDEALELLEPAIREASSAHDLINEAWLRMVRSTVLMRADRWEEAQEETTRAQQTSESLMYPWWDGAVLRQRAVLSAYHASARGVVDGWAASVGAWRDAVEHAASRGSAGEVALTLRAAATVASRLGHAETARQLLAATPSTFELTVMAELFPGEEERLQASAGDLGPPPDLPEALRRARAVLVDDAGPDGEPDPDAPTADHRGALVRDGDGVVVTYAGRTARLRALKGLRDLATLVSRPAVDVHCLELMGGVDVGDAGPQLDERARREYQARIEELQREIDDARDANDPARADRAELELDALVEQLSEAFGLGGRRRRAGSSVERARTAVTYRVRAAIKRLHDVHPPAGKHFDNAIRTGTWCTYRPEAPVKWDTSGW